MKLGLLADTARVFLRPCRNRTVSPPTVSNLDIIRPYGSVGKLEWQLDGRVSYGINAVDIFEVAKNVSTYAEQLETKTVDRINEALERAEMVLF